MTTDVSNPKSIPAKVKKKRKPKKTSQASTPFWMQLNNSSKKPKRKLPK